MPACTNSGDINRRGCLGRRGHDTWACDVWMVESAEVIATFLISNFVWCNCVVAAVSCCTQLWGRLFFWSIDWLSFDITDDDDAVAADCKICDMVFNFKLFHIFGLWLRKSVLWSQFRSFSQLPTKEPDFFSSRWETKCSVAVAAGLWLLQLLPFLGLIVEAWTTGSDKQTFDEHMEQKTWSLHWHNTKQDPTSMTNISVWPVRSNVGLEHELASQTEEISNLHHRCWGVRENCRLFFEIFDSSY